MEHNQPLNKQYILSFLKNKRLATLSTVNKEGLPNAAPIYFIVDDKFNFFFVTPIKTQKNINLEFQNNAVLTITDEEKKETVQVRGKAFRKDELLIETLAKLADKLNHKLEFTISLPLLKHKNQSKTVIKIEPEEIRMRRYSEKKLEEKIIKIKS